MSPYDVLIAGAGPAGCAAAVYAARAGWRTMAIDVGAQSSALGSMTIVRDYPGIHNGTTGSAIIEQMRHQAAEAGAETREAEITSTALGMSGKQLFSRDGAKFEGRSVILATGGVRRTSALPGEAELLGRGVSYSVLRDGSLYRDRVVIVYGKSAEAAHAALDAARFGAKVSLVIPSSKLDMSEHQMEELKKNVAVTLMFSTSLKQINGPTQVNSVTVLSGGLEKELPADGVFMLHKGHKIDVQYLAGTVDCSPDGLVLVNQQLETSIPGVFAAGDILTGEPQIPAVAAAQGIMAALSADRYLRNAPH